MLSNLSSGARLVDLVECVTREPIHMHIYIYIYTCVCVNACFTASWGDDFRSRWMVPQRPQSRLYHRSDPELCLDNQLLQGLPALAAIAPQDGSQVGQEAKEAPARPRSTRKAASGRGGGKGVGAPKGAQAKKKETIAIERKPLAQKRKQEEKEEIEILITIIEDDGCGRVAVYICLAPSCIGGGGEETHRIVVR